MTARRLCLCVGLLCGCLLPAALASAAPPAKSAASSPKVASPRAETAGPTARPASRGSITPEPKHVPLLVRKLGDRSFATREAATRALRQVGIPAKEELLKALEDPDAEIRYRAKLVLADVLEADWRQRLENFVADTNGEQEHNLPGWERYREKVGDNVTARRLFADMHRHEAGLLEAGEMKPAFTGDAIATRCQQIQEARRQPGRSVDRQVPLGSIAALLFVSTYKDVTISTQATANLTNFCYEPAFRQAVVGADASGSPLKKLLADWIGRNLGEDSTATYQTLMLALQFNIREGIEPALAMLKEGVTAPHMRQHAVLVVGRFGGPEHIAQLEPLLKDTDVCARQQTTSNKVVTVIETQIRDVALATMVHLAGQKPADFGFSRAQSNATVLFNTASLGFSKPEDRDAALSKWQTWRTQQAQKK